MGWFGDQATLDYAATIEEGRVVARDIGGSDPERMAPPRVEEYVREVFKGSNISVKVGEYMMAIPSLRGGGIFSPTLVCFRMTLQPLKWTP